MFARRSSQKPPEAFYADFKKNYSYLGPLSEAPVTPAQTSKDPSDMNIPPNFDNPDAANEHGNDSGIDWKFDGTGFLDGENYEAYTGYWPPTPAVGGGGSLWSSNEDPFHNVHPLNHPLQTGLETPLSRAMPGTAFPGPQPGNLTMNDVLPSQYHPSTLYSNQFHGYHLDHFPPEVPSPQHHDYRQAQDHRTSPVHEPLLFSNAPPHGQIRDQSSNFRFRVILHTATAMVKSTDEIPLTYLNKSQTYKLSIKDTMPQFQPGFMTKYRTYVRVSFDDEQQREKPGHCWQLWKEGRGMNEAHQRGGRLQAVEFVHPGQSPSPGRNANFEVVSEAFDGFCITWTANKAGMLECDVQMRFNFLSTDFSHSKGVKGIPVRLCAKTEVLPSATQPATTPADQEVCYCKVKLFRDHGAERKIANDEAHVKKNMEKISQQVAQAQAKLNESGKRRRSDSITSNSRPSKMPKVKRASSVSSLSSHGMKETTVEDDLHGKLSTLSMMLRSRKTESLLFLTGDEQDDPDKYPVSLQGVIATEAFATGSPKLGSLERHSTHMTSTSAGSPALSAASPTSPLLRRSSTLPNLQLPTPSNPTPPKPPHLLHESSSKSGTGSIVKFESPQNAQHLVSPLDVPRKIERMSSSRSEKSEQQWIEAVGVDTNYEAPQLTVKPVACFYILPTIDGVPPIDTHHRAIYLRQRNLNDFIIAIGRKCNIDASLIGEVVHITPRGISIKFDDEDVRELVEGQDMQIDLSMKAKPEDLEEHHEETKPGPAYTLKLHY